MAFSAQKCNDLGDFSQPNHFSGDTATCAIYSRSMQTDLKSQVLDAFLVVLRPVIRILLRYGVGYREFQEVVKTAYVDVASSDFGIRGRPTNISRVAVMTGLTRKEVRRLRDKISLGEMVKVKSTPLEDVLHHWHAEAEFTTTSGQPRTLPFSGDSGSFTSLVRRFGGDIPAGAMRTEMKRVGAVEELNDGSLTVTDRTFRPADNHETLITTLVHSVYPVISNLAHNTNPDRKSDTWAHRVAHTKLLDISKNTQLRRIARDRIIEFAESMDDMFIAFESALDSDEPSDNSAPIAVGVYYFEEADSDAKYEW